MIQTKFMEIIHAYKVQESIVSKVPGLPGVRIEEIGDLFSFIII